MSRFANCKQENRPSDHSRDHEILAVRLAGNMINFYLDYLNQRIKVVNYHSQDSVVPLTRCLNELAAQNGFGKVIVVAREEDWQLFLAQGYIIEAVNHGYFRGRPGYYLSRFFNKERSISPMLIEEDEILQEALQRPVNTCPQFSETGYVLRDATPEDAKQLVSLYAEVFSSYPSPITDPGYLRQFINDNPFKVIMHQENIVCAASAEINPQLLSAELTDCACSPAYRSKGLMSRIIYSLGQELAQMGFKNLYSIARARSHGINTVLRKLGYTYGGRFVNNCTICGQFEDMNLWYKNTGA